MGEAMIYAAMSRLMPADGTDWADAFGTNDRLFVADRISRVTAYRLPNLSVESRRSPPLSFAQLLYRGLVMPLYKVLPRPSDLTATTKYLITGKRAEARGEDLSLRHMVQVLV